MAYIVVNSTVHGTSAYGSGWSAVVHDLSKVNPGDCMSTDYAIDHKHRSMVRYYGLVSVVPSLSVLHLKCCGQVV